MGTTLFSKPNPMDFFSPVVISPKLDTGHVLGHGTGFFIRLNESLFLCTVRHNTDLKYQKASDTRLITSYSLQAFVVRLNGETASHGFLRTEVSSPTTLLGSDGIDLAFLKVDLNYEEIYGRVIVFDKSEFANAGDLRSYSPGSPVYFCGYPDRTPAEKKIFAGKEIETKYPLLRQGVFVCPPSWKFDVSGKLGGKNYGFIDSFAVKGFSGSPIFSPQEGWEDSPIADISYQGYKPRKIIGILCGHLKEDLKDVASGINYHSGMSYFVPSDSILTLLERAETTT
jgi:hypothetical protein